MLLGNFAINLFHTIFHSIFSASNNLFIRLSLSIFLRYTLNHFTRILQYIMYNCTNEYRNILKEYTYKLRKR